MSLLEKIEKMSRKELIEKAKSLNIRGISNKTKLELRELIMKYTKNTDKYIPKLISKKQYEKIYHISDIHIRPLDRHQEYRQVFKQLYQLIGADNLIVITGDLLYEKDKLKPETILLAREFLRNLSEIGDVIIITGNHDMLESNPDRTDNLTAICDDLDVYYLSETGAYQFGDVIFCVSSLKDKKFIYRNNIDFDDDLLYVSLFHGTINGSKTDNNYEFNSSSRFRNKSEFKGYDLVLLGDIHKLQYLNKDKTIAYSGSLIQQNFGEDLKNHGFLEWDIETKKSNFIEIKNSYGFVTINVKNNKYTIPKNIPYNVYLRIILEDSSEDIIDSIKKDINDVKIEKIIVKHQNKEVKINDKMLDVKNESEIFLEEIKLNNYDEEEMLKIHNKLKEKCKSEFKRMNNVRWKILEIKFKNVFIFSNDEIKTLKFEDNIIRMNGPNVSGKTSNVNVILYLLFGGNKKMNELNKSSNNYFIEGIVQYGEQKIKIRKSGIKEKKIKRKVDLYFYENNRWVCKNEDTYKNTLNKISCYFGSYDNFLYTNLSSRSSKSILKKTPQEKLKIFSNFFGLDIYEELESLSKKEIKNITNKIEIEKEKKKLISYDEKDVSIFEIKQKDLENQIDLCKKEKIKFEKKKNKIKYEPIEKKELINIEDEKYQLIIRKKDIDIVEYKTRVGVLREKIIDLDFKINDNYDIDNLEDLIKQNIENNKELLELEKQNYKIEEKYYTRDVIEFKNQNIITINIEEDELKRINSLLFNFKQKDITIIEIPDTFNFDKNNDNIKLLTSDINKLDYKVSEYNKNIKKYNITYDYEEYEKYNIDNIKKMLDDIKNIDNDIIEVKTEISKIKNNVISNELQKRTINIFDTILNKNKKNILKSVLNKKKLEKCKIKREKIKTELDKLEQLRYSYLFNLKEKYNNYKKYQLFLKNKEYRKYLEKVKKYRNISNRIIFLREENDKNDKLIKNMRLYFDNIEKYQNNIKYQKEIDKLQEIIDEQEIRDKYNYTITYLYNEDLKKDFNKILDKIESKDREIVRLENSISLYESRIKEEHKKKNQLDLINDTIKQYNNKKLYYENYYSLVCRHGIPTKIIKEGIKNIKYYINMHLEGIVDYKINIVFEKNGIMFYAIKNGINLETIQLSGYETLMLNLLTKLSINKYSHISKPGLFIIDEGLDVIDNMNMKNFDKIVKFITKINYNLILILNN